MQSEAILRAIDLFEERLCQPVTIAEGAQAAGYSLYHFCRLFAQVIRHTPYDYLIRRRLTRAADDLLHTRCRVLDIALDYQFNSSEAFGRAFRRMFGLLPGSLRKIGALDTRRALPRLEAEYLDTLACLPLRPNRVNLPALELAGWMAPCPPDGFAFTPLWDRLARSELSLRAERGNLNASSEPSSPNNSPPSHRKGTRDIEQEHEPEPTSSFGLLLYPPDWQEQGCLQFAGFPAASLPAKIAPLAHFSLPAQEYACFACETPEANLPWIAAYLFHTWLPHSRLSHLPDLLLFENAGANNWRVSLPLSGK